MLDNEWQHVGRTLKHV